MAINLAVDTSDLVKFTKGLEEGEKVTKEVLTTSVNTIGDQVTSLVATSLARDTGLSLEQVRGLMKVKRAKRGDIVFELTIKSALLEEDAGRKLEGRRESTNFGKRAPDEMVIIVAKDDELVCMDCEELAAAGPMPLQVAKQHIPKHPHCRCVILPYTPKGKRLPVTMTTVSGTDPRKRMGGKKPIDTDMTLRQIVNDVMKKSVGKIRIELKK
jgi:hypothetical protein